MITTEQLAPPPEHEPLIVVSKVKAYIKTRTANLDNTVGGFNTSDKVEGPLTGLIRGILDLAVLKAAADGRKTVLDRDIAHAIAHVLSK